MREDFRTTIRWNPDDADSLMKGFRKSVLKSISDYIRQATLSGQIKPPPPPELIELLRGYLREIHALDNNTNQIARVANASGFPQIGALEEIKGVLKGLETEVLAALRRL